MAYEGVSVEKAWWMSFVAVTIVCMTSLLGVLLVPCLRGADLRKSKLMNFLLALAVGVLVGDALIHLLPHALEHHHVHEHEHHNHTKRTAVEILLGSTLPHIHRGNRIFYAVPAPNATTNAPGVTGDVSHDHGGTAPAHLHPSGSEALSVFPKTVAGTDPNEEIDDLPAPEDTQKLVTTDPNRDVALEDAVESEADHDHSHSNADSHSHDGHTHSHGGHDHSHGGHDHSHDGHDHSHDGHAHSNATSKPAKIAATKPHSHATSGKMCPTSSKGGCGGKAHAGKADAGGPHLHSEEEIIWTIKITVTAFFGFYFMFLLDTLLGHDHHHHHAHGHQPHEDCSVQHPPTGHTTSLAELGTYVDSQENLMTTSAAGLPASNSNWLKAKLNRLKPISGTQREHHIGWLVVIGDVLHNFMDGIAIGVSFLGGGVPLGVSTTIAILLHEIPHEFGDFAILLRAGFGIRRALFWNVTSSLSSFVGMIVGVVIADRANVFQFVCAFTAGTFLHIGLATILPEIQCNKLNWRHRGSVVLFFLTQLGIGIGLSTMIVLYRFEGQMQRML